MSAVLSPRGGPVVAAPKRSDGVWVAAAKRFLLTRDVPVLPLRTDADIADQILRALGGRPGAGHA